MGKPAARVSDMHVCPLAAVFAPHVGGPVLPPGAPTVLLGGLPAARAGDHAQCNGAVDTIVTGSATVLIAGLPAARLGDPTAHGGNVVAGCATVLVGG